MLRAALPLGGARLATESRIKRQYLLATVLVLGLVARGAEGQNQTNCSNLVGSGGSGGVSGEQCSLAAGGNCGCSGRLAAAPLVGVCPSALAGGALGVANLATNATDAFTVNGTIVAPVNLSGAALRAMEAHGARVAAITDVQIAIDKDEVERCGRRKAGAAAGATRPSDFVAARESPPTLPLRFPPGCFSVPCSFL